MAVRSAVLQAAHENGMDAAAGRLSRPVIKAEAGLSLVIADGVEAASAAVRLVAAGERVPESHTQHRPSGQFEHKQPLPLTG
jgi:hypothetical protein